MLYYKVLNKQGDELGFITLNDFRFYHPKRKRMFIAEKITSAQYIIFNGEYYRVSWLVAEDASVKGKYPEVNIILATDEEYKNYIAQLEQEKSK